MTTERSLSSEFYHARLLVELSEARERLEERVLGRVALGYSEVMVRAGVKAAIQRLAIADDLWLESSFLDWLIDPPGSLVAA